MSKPIKVLQVIPQLGPSGISSVVMNWLREIDTNEVTFDFICFSDGQYREEVEALGCKVFKIPTFKQAPLVHIRMVGQILREKDGGYDVIHVHNSFKNFVMLAIAKKYGVALRVCHSHTAGLELTWMKPIFGVIKSVTKRLSNLYVACGIEAGKFLFGYDKFTVLNNAIKVESYLPSANDEASVSRILAQYNIPSNKQLLIHVGRFSEVKNHTFLLELANSASLSDDYHFVCVGEGPLKQLFIHEIKECRLSHRFSILPANNDIALLLSASSAFVMPSLFEGVSVALLEAQAAQLPCFVADTISLEADMGLALVEFLSLESPDHWVEQLNHLKDKSLEDAIIKQAFYNKQYSIEAVTEQLVTLYKNALEAR